MSSGTVVSSTPTTVNSLTLPAGAWIIFGNITYNAFAGDYSIASISQTNNATDTTCMTTLRWNGTAQQNIGVTRGVVPTSTTTFFLVGQASGGVAAINVTMYAIRVA